MGPSSHSSAGRALAEAAAVALLALASPCPGPAAAADYHTVWAEEFDGRALDPARFEAQLGDGCPSLCGWGNNELQYYRAENASVGGGRLRIAAREESFGGASYTSARLRSRALAEFRFGRFEVRARMPRGQGLWPAFWMLPSDEVYGTWAASGEIDVVEYLGHQPDRALGAIHYGGTWPGNQSTSNDFTLGQGSFDQGFHTFALEWQACRMRWYVDGGLYATETTWSSTGGPYPAPFDQRFHLLLNLAVGGNLPGPPDASTDFPQHYTVDHVRVAQRDDFPACHVRFDDMEHAAPLSNGWFAFGGSVGGGGIGADTSASAPLDDGCQASLATGWGSGGTPGFFGGFGRTHPVDLTAMTHMSFWIDPDPGQEYTLEVNLQDDDDGDDAIPSTPDGADDEFQYDVAVGPAGPDVIAGGGWQRVSIPLASFVDDNGFHFGGNGVLDPFPTAAGGNGQLVNVVVVVIGGSGSDVNFRTDDWRFSQEVSAVSGRVWDDADRDGVPGAGEPGLAGVTLVLRDAQGSPVGSVATPADGSYAFPALPWGRYTIEVDEGSLPPGRVPTRDPDGISTPASATLLLGCAASHAAEHFGFGPRPALPALPPAGVLLLAAALLAGGGRAVLSR